MAIVYDDLCGGESEGLLPGGGTSVSEFYFQLINSGRRAKSRVIIRIDYQFQCLADIPHNKIATRPPPLGGMKTLSRVNSLVLVQPPLYSHWAVDIIILLLAGWLARVMPSISTREYGYI